MIDLIFSNIKNYLGAKDKIFECIKVQSNYMADIVTYNWY